MCVNTTPGWKHSRDLLEAAVVPHLSGEDQRSFPNNSFCRGSGKWLRWLSVFPGVDVPTNEPEGQTVQYSFILGYWKKLA